jgi:hypothetical protein
VSITVYWACNDESWLRAKTPEPIYKEFVQNSKNQENGIILCPATKDYMQNIFSLKSLFDYNFKLNSNEELDEVFTDQYDQKFFNDHVLVRSRKDRLFSIFQKFIFFTEEKSLLMSGGLFPFLENNNITKQCTIIPGTFNIGKWFRQLEFAFYLKEEYDQFKIEEDEIFQYIKFETKEKIIFKQFKVTSEIQNFLLDIDKAKEFRKIKIRALEEYYSMLKHKKYIINEIKNNLI